MKMSKIRGIIILFIVATIWGFAFVAQSSSVDLIPTFTINFLRSIFAFVALVVFSLIKKKVHKKEEVKCDKKLLLKAGVLSGVFLFIATNIQQFGISFTTAGKAGFITALYIIFVPIIGLFLKKKVGLNIWISVILAIAGFYFLTIFGSNEVIIGKGELAILICAVFFALQIIVVDKYVKEVDGVKLSIVQFAVMSILSFIPMLFEKASIENIIKAMPSLLYLGVISSGVGYTLQIIGQKDVNPTVASLIMSLEAVFSAVFGAIVLKEALNMPEIFGCVLIFSGVVLSQIVFEKNKKVENGKI